MTGYFMAQCKRLLKFFPYIFALMLILFVSFFVAFRAAEEKITEEDLNTTMKIGVTGDTDNKYFQLGLQTLSAIDSSRFTIQIIEVEEATAKNLLLKGEISAYVVIPEGFMKDAMHGTIRPIKYVTGSGGSGLTEMFKDEITEILKKVVVSSQNGIFSVEDILTENGLSAVRREHSDNVNFEYIDLAISRVEMYSVEYTGVSAGVSTVVTTACGIASLFLFVSGIGYAVVFVRKDSSLNLLFASRARGFKGQILCEFFAFVLSYIPTLLAVFGIGVIFLKENFMFSQIYSLAPTAILCISLAVFFNLFLFEISDGIVTGVLLQFVITLFMSYVSGCMYPVYSLPKILQKTAALFPSGTVRVCLENAIKGQTVNTAFLGVGFYILLFASLTYFARCYRAGRKI